MSIERRVFYCSDCKQSTDWELGHDNSYYFCTCCGTNLPKPTLKLSGSIVHVDYEKDLAEYDYPETEEDGSFEDMNANKGYAGM